MPHLYCIRGEVNITDLFNKHLGFKKKIKFRYKSSFKILLLLKAKCICWEGR